MRRVRGVETIRHVIRRCRPIPHAAEHTRPLHQNYTRRGSEVVYPVGLIVLRMGVQEAV